MIILTVIIVIAIIILAVLLPKKITDASGNELYSGQQVSVYVPTFGWFTGRVISLSPPDKVRVLFDANSIQKSTASRNVMASTVVCQSQNGMQSASGPCLDTINTTVSGPGHTPVSSSEEGLISNMASGTGLSNIPFVGAIAGGMDTSLGGINRIVGGDIGGGLTDIVTAPINTIGNIVGNLFSDDKLKTNIRKISNTSHPGITKYIWTWNEKANSLGLHGTKCGYLASEIEKVWPEIVNTHTSGYKLINNVALSDKIRQLSFE